MTTQDNVRYKFDLVCQLYNFKTSATFDPDTRKFSNAFVKMEYPDRTTRRYRMGIIEVSTTQNYFQTAARLTGNEMLYFLEGLIAAKNMHTQTRIINQIK